MKEEGRQLNFLLRINRVLLYCIVLIKYCCIVLYCIVLYCIHIIYIYVRVYHDKGVSSQSVDCFTQNPG